MNGLVIKNLTVTGVVSRKKGLVVSSVLIIKERTENQWNYKTALHVNKELYILVIYH